MQFITNSKETKPLTKEMVSNEKQNTFLSIGAFRKTH